MTTEEDKPDLDNKSFADTPESELKLIEDDLHRALTDSEDDTPKKNDSKTDQTSGEVKERKALSEKKPVKRLNKLRPVLSLFALAFLVGIFISYYLVKDSRKLPGNSRVVKKENIQSYIVKTELNKTSLKRPNTISLRKDKTKIQRESSTNQDVHDAGEELSLLKLKSPETIESLTQNDRAISKENPLMVEQPLRLSSSFQAREDSNRRMPELEKRVVLYPYSVYLGSFRTRKRVQRADSIYRKMGLSPYWIKVDLGDKGVWFRVFTGHFKNKEEAEAFIKEKQIPEARPKHTKYATLVGTYKSEVELNKNRLGLSDLGYCPYIIDGINGEYRLYSGVFYQKRRAQRHAAQLVSKGFQSQVVER